VQYVDDRCLRVIRKPGEKYSKACVKQTVKHPLYVMIWSFISLRGVGEVFIVDGAVNSQAYINIINSTLIPSIPML
jgi:hypothetical protein